MYLSKDRASVSSVTTVRGRRVRRRRNGGGLVGELMLCFPTRPPQKLLTRPVSTPSTPNSDQPRSQLSPTPLLRIVANTNANGKRRKGKGLLNMNSGVMPSTSEPTSPKVSCVGQIKMSSAASTSGIGEEVKRSNWFEALGLKNEIVHFFHAIRGFRLRNVGCFGKFRGSAVDDYTTDEEEEEESRVGSLDDSSIPPSNALLLMRCRSAPANGLLRREEKPEEKEDDGEECLKLSSQVIKETWVIGTADPLMIRCRSLKK